MKIGQTEIEHQSDIINAMLNDTARRYFKYSKLNPDTDQTGILSQLSRDAGYLIATNLVAIKTFKQEKRLKVLEEKIKTDLSTPMRMFEEPQMEKYR